MGRGEDETRAPISFTALFSEHREKIMEIRMLKPYEK